MYMTPAIAVAILTFAVGLQAQPLGFDNSAIITRNAQPEAYANAYADAYADAYVDAKLEARGIHAGDALKGALTGVAANIAANKLGYGGTSNTKAALAGAGLNVALHSHHLQDAANSIFQRDAEAEAEAEAEAYADAYADAELEARGIHAGDMFKGAIAGVGANLVANQFGHGTSNLNAALLGGIGNAALHSQHVQHAGQKLSNAVQQLVQRDTEAIMYQLERRGTLRNVISY
ncbi:hypothetical protein MMC17_005802 [Xylographa soralifera]|nr:hypothetical protein [Xylographa soralifera]